MYWALIPEVRGPNPLVLPKESVQEPCRSSSDLVILVALQSH